MAVIFAAGLLLAWLFVPAATAGPCEVVSSASLPGIRETSGLAISRRTPGVLWTHNDSGNAAVLFAIDTAGVVRGRVRVPIRARDWEDVSAARCQAGDCLYIADIGDNRVARRQIQIYRVPEPAVTETETAAPEVFNATYADGPHNAEAMFVIGADLFIVTRDRVGGLYRSTLSSSRDLSFTRVGPLGLGGVTDAETSRDGRSVVVRTSYEAVFYRPADLLARRFVPYLSIPIGALKEPQGEGVAFDGDKLYLSSEGRFSSGGWFVSLRCTGM
jgi:hypothetical protein